MFDIWLDPSRRNQLFESDLKLRQRFFGFAPRTNPIVSPTCPQLRAQGERRPVWLGIIFYFFSKDFTNRAFKAGLWPLTLYLHDETCIRWLGFVFSVFVLHSMIF